MTQDIDSVLQHAETVVVGNRDPDFKEVPKRLRKDQQLVDLVRISDQRSGNGNYSGICW
jgi:GDP-mannose 6-dehydrogenase